MIELEDYIKTYFGIPEEKVKKVCQLFHVETLKKGSYFLKRKQFCNRFSFIQSGLLRVYSTHKQKEITQWIASKGYFVTDVYAFVFNQRSRWNIQAINDCSLISISETNYQNIKTIVPNWDELEKKFIAECFLTLEDRIFSHLSMTAEERYDQFIEHNEAIMAQIPLNYLASMLGMTPETLSRIRKKRLT
jgi:CRP-like cAMP-binding protein